MTYSNLNMDYAQNFRWSVTPTTKSIVCSVLEEFRSLYRWQNTQDDEERTALDIGFGDGSVTVEVIKPFLPASTRLDGADKSEDMIRFAKHCYEKQGFIFFFWDVEREILNESMLKSYDHIFSFFCLHYVEETRKVLKNIYDILKPNGNLLLTFVPNLPFHTAMKTLSISPKWASYMQDINTVCPQPFVKEKFPHKVFAELMSECGFRNVITKVDVKNVLTDSWDKLEAQAWHIDIFSKRMPLELQGEFFAEFMSTLKQIEGFWTEKHTDTGEFFGVLASFEVVTAYGEKSSR